MATITLTTDTLISTLMPAGGGSLASGDTIQLAGHSLIIDADAVDYPVSITNSGGDANLELRDLGRIKLNATLPANVHPYIDPAHPLPVSAEPGIDGDPYRTNLTANARAEIQLNGNFGLGGGAASLPTETREGRFYATASFPTATSVVLSDNIPIHSGDCLAFHDYRNGFPIKVLSYDSTSKTAMLDASVPSRTEGLYCGIFAGGVLIRHTANSAMPIIDSPIDCGTLNLWGNSLYSIGMASSCNAKRVCWCPAHSGQSFQNFFAMGPLFLHIDELFCTYFLNEQYNSMSSPFVSCDIKHVCAAVTCDRNENADLSFGEGYCGTFTSRSSVSCKCGEVKHDAITIYSQFSFFESGGLRVEKAGTITAQSNGSFYLAPATAADVTWRYTDRTVPPGATIRLRCAWQREGSSASRASVAVTDTATWWPQLWPLGADSLASVEFTGGTADWRSELLTWRNTGTEAATVRVWECVTGTVAGGYLKVEEVKGGAL